MAKISIHRALTLIAKSQDTLSSSICNGIFLGLIKTQSSLPVNVGYRSVEDLISRITSDTHKVESVLNLIPKLKEAIAKKNLETKVNFLGKEVSVTELLAIKQTIGYRRSYVSVLRDQLLRANNQIETVNQTIEKQVSSYAGTDKLEYQKNLEALSGISLLTLNDKSLELKIKEMTDELDFLSAELDITLSEINLSTMIEIDMDI